MALSILDAAAAMVTVFVFRDAGMQGGHTGSTRRGVVAET